MEKTSLVGLKATDVVKALARDRAFYLTSYRDPIGIVVPVNYTSRSDFYKMVETIAKELFDEHRE